MSSSRRAFLLDAARATAAISLGVLPARRGDRVWRRSAAYPFALGIASGDPAPTGVVLWTRLAPDPLHGGGMDAKPVSVAWEVAADDAFRRIVRRGNALAVPDLAHSVHVEVDGLEPAREYWYRFIAGGEASPIGRTRTAPAMDASPDALRFAFVSCQNWQQGLYTAYGHLAEEEIDLVVHLGDYIYESGAAANPSTVVRLHEGPEPTTLEAYRGRYGLYKSDPHLQAAHAHAPFILTWDDHEVENDYAGTTSENDDPVDMFLARRAAAYQAYYEHIPLRRTSMPKGPHAQMYRRLSYGRLAGFHVLDTRQYRTDQPCGDGRKLRCAEVVAESATITGSAQERWLLDGLDRSPARWNVVANQVPFVQLASAPGPAPNYPVDKWDGYIAERTRVLDFLARRRPSNPVIITGDVHYAAAADIRASFDDPRSPLLGVELIGTSISSGGDGSHATSWGADLLAANPHLHFHNAQRGYVRCTVTKEKWIADYRVVPYVSRPGAPIQTQATFTVLDGEPGLQHSALGAQH
jgi:alkaline phosphatase D